MMSVKIQLAATGELRRFGAAPDVTLSDLQSTVASLFPATPGLSLSYTDEDGDAIALTTTEELHEAKRLAGARPLRLVATTTATTAVAVATTTPPVPPPAAPVCTTTPAFVPFEKAPKVEGDDMVPPSLLAAIAEAGLSGVVRPRRLARIAKNHGHDTDRVLARLRQLQANSSRSPGRGHHHRGGGAGGRPGRHCGRGHGGASSHSPDGAVNPALLAAMGDAGIPNDVVPPRRLVRMFARFHGDVPTIVSKLRDIHTRRSRVAEWDATPIPAELTAALDGAGLAHAKPRRLHRMLANANNDVAVVMERLQTQESRKRARMDTTPLPDALLSAMTEAGVSNVVQERRLRVMLWNHGHNIPAVVAKLKAIKAERGIGRRRGGEAVALLCQKYAAQLAALDARGFADYRPRLRLLNLLAAKNGDVDEVAAAARAVRRPSPPAVATTATAIPMAYVAPLRP